MYAPASCICLAYKIAGGSGSSTCGREYIYIPCAGESNYLTDVDTWFNAHNELESAEDSYMITDWDHIYWASNVLLANSTDLGAFHTAAQVLMIKKTTF